MKYVMGGICVGYMLACVAFAGLLGYRAGSSRSATFAVTSSRQMIGGDVLEATIDFSMPGPVKLAVPEGWQIEGIAEREE